MQQQGLIPTPPDFPVNWENPDDEWCFWTRDAMHFPNQVNTLEEEFLVRIAQGHGFARARRRTIRARKESGAPRQHLPLLAMAPAVAPEEMKPRGSAPSRRWGKRWPSWASGGGEYVPEIQEYLKDWDRFDLRGASMPELLDHLDETVARFSRLWRSTSP